MLSKLLKSRLLMLLSCLLLLLALPFFFVNIPASYSTPLFRAIWDCGHILFFGGLVFALHTYVDFSKPRAGIILSMAVFVVGGLIEVVQAYTGRDGEWQDLLRDMAGTWLVLFWLQQPNYKIWLGRIISVILLFPTIIPIYSAAKSQRFAEQQFPVIADFEDDIDLHGIVGKIERNNTLYTSGHYSLKVHLNTDQYSGVTFTDFFHTWQGYRYFSLDIYNPDSEPIDLTIRIDDIAHQLGNNAYNDRFNKSLHIEPGWSHIKISVDEIQHAPAKRLLQLSEIKSIVVYAKKLPADRDIYIDNVRLQ